VERKRRVSYFDNKDDDGPNPDKVNYALDAYLGSLKMRLVNEEERLDWAKDHENDLRNEEIELSDKFKQLWEDTWAKTKDL